MSNNGCRIILDRREGGQWFWELTMYGELHKAKQGASTAIIAAHAADNFRSHLNLFKDQRLKAHSA
jgi:hypothetical protein